MDEFNWLSSENARELIQWINNHNDKNGLLSKIKNVFLVVRRIRLFGVACCRIVLGDRLDDSQIKFVDKVEALTEQPVSDKYTNDLAYLYKRLALSSSLPFYTNEILLSITVPDAYLSPIHITSSIRNNMDDSVGSGSAVFANADRIQASILRDIIGNPWRIRDRIAGKFWMTSTVTSLAEAIYQQKAFDQMPILADALEEACCDFVDMMQHCRGFQRCWHCLDQYPLNQEYAASRDWCTYCGMEGYLPDWWSRTASPSPPCMCVAAGYLTPCEDFANERIYFII